MIFLSRTFTKCLLTAGLMLGAAGAASAQSGNYSFPLVYGPLTGYVFTSYTSFNSTCGVGGKVPYTETTYTVTGWTISGSGPTGGGSLASGSISFITVPQQAECPTPGWQNPRAAFNLISPGYFSSCSSPSTGWEGGYVSLEAFPTVSASKFQMTLPAGCPS